MLVTLMTDASHCSTTKAAGFGFWCVSNRGKLSGGKPLNGVVRDAYQAEAKAVANSLIIGFRSGIIQQGDKVIVQLDNLAVVNGLMGKSNKVRKDVMDVLRFIKNFKIENNIEIECRHVKGHTKRKENRFKANNHCDKIAKKQMKLARATIYN